jgi:eukaryotic-like serine/threonine-protein kinase
VLAGHHSYVYHAVFSPDGKLIASAGWRNEVKVWDAESGRLLATLEHTPEKAACALALGFGDEGRSIVVRENASIIRQWGAVDAARGVTTLVASEPSTQDWKVMRRLAPGARGVDAAGGQCAALSPDGRRLAVASQSSIEIQDEDGKVLKRFSPSSSRLKAVAWAPDGTHLAAAGEDTLIYVLDAAAGTVTSTLLGHRQTVYSLAFSPDGARLVSGSEDNAVIIWNPREPAPLLELHRHAAYVHAVGFSPDGTRLVSGSGDGTVRIWDGRP